MPIYLHLHFNDDTHQTSTTIESPSIVLNHHFYNFSHTAYHSIMNVMVKLLTEREHLSTSINPVLIVGIRDRGQASLTSKILQLATSC